MSISHKITHMGKTFDWAVTEPPAPGGTPAGVPSFAAPGAGAIRGAGP